MLLARITMHWRAIVGEEAGQDTVEFSLLLALVVIIAVATFPFTTGAIASICAKTEEHLHRAITASWQ
jgi:hypothetical protein